MTALRREQYAFRSQLVDELRKDLIGPSAESEEIKDAPVTRYALGILFPSDAGEIDGELDVDVADEGDESSFGDPPVAMANTRYPSSVGVTVAVDLNISDELVIHSAAARYEPDGDPASASSWTRHACELSPATISVAQPWTDEIDLGDRLALYFRVRKPDAANVASITVALVNRRSGSWPRDPDCFFQTSISLRGGNGSACFTERRPEGAWASDEELTSYRLLYRHARNFGAGHGCAAAWEDAPDATHVSEVHTNFMPDHALRLADSNPSIDTAPLRLRTLSTDPRDAVLDGLRQLCSGYHDWIEARRGEATALEPQDLRATATKHLADATNALDRMRAGVDLLATDDRAWLAFQLANRAMLEQRSRTSWHERGNPAGGPDPDEDHRWRPFQLAFILLCLRGIVDEAHPERELADLLWFPTGGGKTEAYLGLIAFTLFHRRLRDGASGDGVGVFMRYTLRLLTIQQFERAALLTCCCEQVRVDEPSLGDEPFLIGLWVGRGGTPNKLDDAADAITRLRNGQEVLEGNPVQVHSCPWCGASLSVYDYWCDTNKARLRLRCPAGKKDSTVCPFGDDLPVILVDEELYNRRPSLMIATADKFAALPWRSSTGRIFGIGTTSRPPELIIQDELHLISGPLGTLAGLYETAVDFLCQHHGRRPKVIASTATIRRADRQTQALFAREMKQFPPPGIDARDSYFATETSPEDKATRAYVGVMAPALSQTTLMVRTYASVLESTGKLPAQPEVKDPYWTLVGYFNSLRVLGGARMQVKDDVEDRIELLAGEDGGRMIGQTIELTSREASSEIPSHLERMKIRHPDDEALDVILATNMISVGVDIDRLGLMVVMGQPQSTSEYIQSTSRVGRRHPGLVVVLYNAARSRDRSHYESFRSYHQALYRQVESTSVTPFSARSRDRGLHAVLIALARLSAPGFKENGGAANIEAHLDTIEILKERILERVAAVSEPDEVEPTRKQLDEIVALWRRRAEDTPKLLFNQPFQLDRSLLWEAAKGSIDDGNFPTLWSLRDVDLESNLYMVG